MDTFIFIVGVIGNIISILMFLSPGKTFLRIVKNKSTEEFESLPYICTLLNSSLWTYYGIIKPGSYLVATVNGFGVLVEIIYVALFLSFAPPQRKARTAALCGILNIGFFVAAASLAFFLLDGELRINALGLTCSGLNVVMYGSPLSAVKTVVTTKSVEYMPFLLSLFLMLNGGVWSLYALLSQDWFLGVPNAIGFLLGALQLVLYAVYRNPKPSTHLPADFAESWLQKEQFLPASTSASGQC